MKRSNYLLKTLAVCSMISGSCLSLNAQGVALDWAKQISSTGQYSMGMAVTTDAAGNVYTCGRFDGSTDFDPGPGTVNMTADGITDIFITKMNVAGQLVWAKKMGSISQETEQAVSIAVDANGNVYTTGIYGGYADFDPGPGNAFLTFGGGWSDAFISKLDSAGNFVWAKSISGPEDETGVTVTLDQAGNIYLLGSFSGTVDFDPGAGVSTMTSAQVAGFITKLDTGGNFVWARQLSGAGHFLSGGMTVASSGNIYIAGSILDNTVDINPGSGTMNITPEGFIDACIVKLDNNGNFVWGKQIGGIFSLAFGLKVVVDAQENVFHAGVYAGGIDFGTGAPALSLSSNATEDTYITKLDAAGNFLWTKSTAGGNSSAIAEVYSFTTDATGNLYMGGFFSNTVDFDPGAGTSNLSTVYGSTIASNAFFLKLDNSGNFKWAKQVAGTGTSLCRGISVDHSGNVYTTGDFTDTSDFDPGSPVLNFYSLAGTGDIFVSRFSCTDTTSSLVSEKEGKCSGYEFNGVTYHESGIYTVKFMNASGCDSTVTLDLTIHAFQAAITANAHTLTAAAPYTTYQWLLNGNAIAGATTNTYVASENGQYKLAATNEDGCTDTSDVYAITDITGIDDIASVAAQIHVYPNPATDILFVQAPLKVNLTLTDIAGKTLLQANDTRTLSVKSMVTGVYFLRITDKNGHTLKTEKIVKGN